MRHPDLEQAGLLDALDGRGLVLCVGAANAWRREPDVADGKTRDGDDEHRPYEKSVAHIVIADAYREGRGKGIHQRVRWQGCHARLPTGSLETLMIARENAKAATMWRDLAALDSPMSDGGYRPREELALEKLDEVAVEVVEELVHIDDVPGGDGVAGGGAFGFDECVDVEILHLLGETAQRELGFLWVAIVEDGGDEVARVAVVAFDEHRPDIGFTGEDLDVLRIEFAMADDTAMHASEYDLLDLTF